MQQKRIISAIVLFGLSPLVLALEMGFESSARFDATDNVLGAESGFEEEGQIANITFGVYGEQQGTKVRGAFAGELSSQRRVDDPDDEFTAVSQFLGAAEISITPRAFTWYIGDILGGVRADNGLQTINDEEQARRNVFVTGPRFEYEIDSVSRANAQFRYVNQSEEGTVLESLYNTTASYEYDTSTANTYGVSFGNIYTDHPSTDLEGDFNRLSLGGFWRRNRGQNEYFASLGGTRYDTETEALNGVNARFRYDRALSEEKSINLSFRRDLRDQTLNEIDTLIENGTGVDATGDGFFDETRIDAGYNFNTGLTTFNASVGVGQSDFRLLADNTGATSNGDSEDRNNLYGQFYLSQVITSGFRISTGANYIAREYINRDDNSQSVVGSIELEKRLSRSFIFDLGYFASYGDGQRTSEETNLLEDFEIVENRVKVGIRWAPPSRADKDVAIELRSLLQ